MSAILKINRKPYKVTLPVFEGPLDLLLYLIQKQELDIYDIPIAQITGQYLEYLGMMELLDLEIAGEFLVMTATLMEIKSKMLLPPEETPEGETDPRGELVNRLLEYQKFKEGALKLEQMESYRRDFISRSPTTLASFEGEVAPEEEWWDLSLYELMKGMRNVLDSMSSKTSQAVREVMEELVTVEGRIQWILEMLVHKPAVYLSQILKEARGKMEIVATVLAGLELSKASQVRLKQDELFGEVEIVRTNR
ncbi:MAG: segregation/condensation protein A [Candidatus Omnitrophica bacterium]|nr:segregation/condensation protein A [Candidatus Omnitrophota bacterium]